MWYFYISLFSSIAYIIINVNNYSKKYFKLIFHSMFIGIIWPLVIALFLFLIVVFVMKYE